MQCIFDYSSSTALHNKCCNKDLYNHTDHLYNIYARIYCSHALWYAMIVCAASYSLRITYGL